MVTTVWSCPVINTNRQFNLSVKFRLLTDIGYSCVAILEAITSLLQSVTTFISTERSTSRPLKMSVFTEGMARTMEKIVKRKLGHDKYEELLEESEDWTDEQGYGDLILPQTGIGRDCDDNLPFTVGIELPTGIPPILPDRREHQEDGD